MHSLKEIQLKCNKQIFINFDGGELSSDGGLLMIKEFLYALGFEKLLKQNFKTNDSASFRIHKDDEVCCLEPSIGNGKAVLAVTGKDKEEQQNIKIFGVEINEDTYRDVSRNGNIWERFIT